MGSEVTLKSKIIEAFLMLGSSFLANWRESKADKAKLDGYYIIKMVGFLQKSVKNPVLPHVVLQRKSRFEFHVIRLNAHMAIFPAIPSGVSWLFHVKSAGFAHLQFFDSSLMTSPLEFGVQPDIDYLEGIFNGYHSPAECDHIGIVVLFGQSCTLLIPA